MEPLTAVRPEERRDPPLRLRRRDFDLLAHLAKHRWAPVDEIRDLFWPGPDSRNYYRRLSTLERFRLIKPLKGDRDARLGYLMTQAGADLLKARGVNASRPRSGRPMYKSAYDHDRILRRVRAIFESSPIVSAYLGEKEIRSELARRHGMLEGERYGYKVPDGYFELKTSNGKLKIGVELEIAAKSRERYANIFKRLALSRDMNSFFFVVASPSVLTRLTDELAKLRRSGAINSGQSERGFYFILLKDLLDQGLRAKFRGEGTSFSLAGLARNAASDTAG